MKIQNLTSTTSYFGYEAHGFYLNPNEVSREMPAAMAANTYLRQDVEQGRVRLLCDATDRANLKSMELELPNADKPAAEAPRASKMAVVPKDTVNLMKVELQTYLNGMGSLPEKVKYLEDLIEKGKPQAKGIAEQLLAPLKAQLVTDVTSHVKEEEPSKQKLVVPVDEIKNNEPQINIGHKEDPVIEGTTGAPGVKEVTRTKAIAQMSKLELLSYGTTLGCDINPMTAHKDLKEKVAAKEKELGFECKK